MLSRVAPRAGDLRPARARRPLQGHGRGHHLRVRPHRRRLGRGQQGDGQRRHRQTPSAPLTRAEAAAMAVNYQPVAPDGCDRVTNPARLESSAAAPHPRGAAAGAAGPPAERAGSRAPAVCYSRDGSLSRCETPARPGPSGRSICLSRSLVSVIRQGVFFYREGSPHGSACAQGPDHGRAGHEPRAHTRIAHEIIERNEGAEHIALVGIVRPRRRHRAPCSPTRSRRSRASARPWARST